MGKLAAVLAVIISIAAACGPPPHIVSVAVSEDDVRARQAEGLVRKGHYTAYQRAAAVYANLYANRDMRPRVAASYAAACLRLALREKDLGIDNPAALKTVERLLRENPGLAPLRPYFLLVGSVPPRSRGVMRDIDTPGLAAPAAVDELRAAETEVTRLAGSDEFAAVVDTARSCAYGQFSVTGGSARLDGYLKLYPDSAAMKYEAAICGQGRPELLEELLAADPEFAEAHYHLGEDALNRRQLLEAEGHLLKAAEALPESPQPRILLAGIYFATEEFDKSLQFYDLTLALSPEFRDALLGQAICQGYLGRHEEAMAGLEKILGLGYWLLGEAHYWLAWNLHELKRDAEALGHIDEAKGRLPTNAEVFSLSGTLAFEQGDLERAGRDYAEAVKYDAANAEALYGLGNVAAKRSLWAEAGDDYAKAVGVLEAGETALRAKIEETQQAAMAEERKARLVRRRESQLERLRLALATACYDAAAAYANAGAGDRAAGFARKCAAHPAFKEKAEDLLRSLKKGTRY